MTSLGALVVLTRLPEWDWAIVDDKVLANSLLGLDIQELPTDLSSVFLVNSFFAVATLCTTRGDLVAAHQCLDRVLQMVAHLQEAIPAGEIRKLAMLWVPLALEPSLTALERGDDFTRLLALAGSEWGGYTGVDAFVDALADQMPDGMMSPRGATEREGDEMFSADSIAWQFKLLCVLGAAAGAAPPPAALLVALPTADVLESYDPKRNIMTRFGGAKTAFVLAAEVCLKLGHPEAALPYLAKALRHDVAPSQRDDRPTARAHAEVRKALGCL